MDTSNSLDTRRILIFIGFTFGIAWLTALAIYLMGGIEGSPLIAGLIPLSVVLMAFPMMWSPAIAHVLTRLVTREGWQGMMLRPTSAQGSTSEHWLMAWLQRLWLLLISYFSQGRWKYLLISWLLIPLLFLIGGALYFALNMPHFDINMSVVSDAAAQQLGGEIPIGNLRLLIAAQLLATLAIVPFINGIFTFGEEFGWRAYLQPKLMPLGGRKAMLLGGLIWGVWHWPVIAMGHNYGQEYPGFPYSGMLMFTVFTVALAIIEGWLTLKSRNVWPSVITHAMANGFAGTAALFLAADVQPNPLIGPLPVGIIGMLPVVVFAAMLFIHPTALTEAAPPAEIETTESPAITAPARC